jgi:PQ loop repeat
MHWIQWCRFADILDNSLLLFLVFFPRGPTLPIDEAEQQQYTWKTAVTVAFVCLLHGLAVIIISAVLIMSRPHHLGTWANILGITATILAAIQYFPQIWMTWHLGHVGSLSIPMMLIQTPGSFVWSGSLAARLGIEGWSTWGVFLVTGCLQGCLLGMGIYFEVQARKAKQSTEGEASFLQIMNLKARIKLTFFRLMQDALLVTFKARMVKQRLMMKVVL